MRIGARSLLFGAHQFLLHPYYVSRAWRLLYGRSPDLAAWAAIITHDWGYWGALDMDGETGERHPERMADWWWRRGAFGRRVSRLIRGHSRFHAVKVGVPLSPLYAADKLSLALMPRRLYLFLAKASGELREYMEQCGTGGRYEGQDNESEALWFLSTQAVCIEMALSNRVQPDAL